MNTLYIKYGINRQNKVLKVLDVLAVQNVPPGHGVPPPPRGHHHPATQTLDNM